MLNFYWSAAIDLLYLWINSPLLSLCVPSLWCKTEPMSAFALSHRGKSKSTFWPSSRVHAADVGHVGLIHTQHITVSVAEWSPCNHEIPVDQSEATMAVRQSD